MRLKTEPVTKHSPNFPQIKNLYNEAFPPKEKAPLSILLRKARKPFVDFTAYYAEESANRTFIGFTYLAYHENLVFVMYLAVDPSLRSKGYGSEILEQLRRSYPDSRIILNIEAADPNAPNHAERLRRREFYVRSGYTGSGFHVQEFGVLYEALVHGGPVEPQQFLRLHRRFMGFPLSVLGRLKIFSKPDVPLKTDE
ncbi:GNAT family N-acetyltransferase [Saccharibacillus kuerlensis]|uniref:N-acetyltransferase n=1 Tax=Saccharibacillus kuerlensis TaxID=459527 RepID=A0ABQ2L5K1_9BACL|nr:GNAT family N-acetyltransferase [Saccharibacillus kuerlensis]GGO01277.1 N-acetyltransferase [Saccharibacillus kuerlensis]